MPNLECVHYFMKLKGSSLTRERKYSWSLGGEREVRSMVSCVALNQTQTLENCFLAGFSWAFAHTLVGIQPSESSLQGQKLAGAFGGIKDL